MDMGQRLGSWSLDKERSNVLHSPCLSQPGVYPYTASLWFIHHSYLCFSLQILRVCRQEANSPGGGMAGSRLKGECFSPPPEPAVSNEQSHVLHLYYLHSPSQVFWMLDGRAELACLSAVRAGSMCPLVLAG